MLYCFHAIVLWHTIVDQIIKLDWTTYPLFSENNLPILQGLKKIICQPKDWKTLKNKNTSKFENPYHLTYRIKIKHYRALNLLNLETPQTRQFSAWSKIDRLCHNKLAVQMPDNELQ